MPVRFIDAVMANHKGFLVRAYPALVKAENTHDGKENQPYKKLTSPRKFEDNGRLKRGRHWTEVIQELDYARDQARRQARKCRYFKFSLTMAGS
jgi:hypothetical protein